MMTRYRPASALRLLLSLLFRTGEWWKALGVNAPAAGRVTASAADGIRLALALIPGAGRVIVPAYTCDRVIAAVCSAGDTPWLIDIDPASGSYLRDSVLGALAARPKALVLTHLFGMDKDAQWLIQSATAHNTPVVEDTSLLLDLRRRIGPQPPVSVFSFGRGKPLGLGGGGALIVRDTELASRLQVTGGLQSEQTRLGLAGLVAGAARDGTLMLWLTSIASRFRKTTSRGSRGGTRIPTLTSRRQSAVAERAIASTLRCIDVERLERANRSALTRYREAFEAEAVNLSGELGHRLAAGTISPAVALTSSQRDRIVSRLAREGLDCPLYWTYSVARRMGLTGFPGAERLSRSLIFLPLHGGVSRKHASRVAKVLSRYEVSTFS